MKTSLIKKNIYVAWSNETNSYSFISTIKTIESLGYKPIILEMVKSYDLNYQDNGLLNNASDEHGILLPEYARKIKNNKWKNSNVEDIAKDIDCIVFPGGSDISPTLYKNEQGWHGIDKDTDYCAERDVSDYILMSYCLEKDIPLFAICRGMQMLSVVSGADMINDIPSYFSSLGLNENQMHRDKEKKIFVPHDVDVLDTSSLLYKVTGEKIIEKVPSWHHQGVLSTEGTKLTVTGITKTSGINLIEAVERKDLSFCLGVQFHPEVASRKHIDKENDSSEFMKKDIASSFIKALSKI